jgi:hypothetical protein
MSKEDLIQRKVEVQAEMSQLRGQLAALADRAPSTRSAARQAEIEAQLAGLMAEESRLRQLIDRNH